MIAQTSSSNSISMADTALPNSTTRHSERLAKLLHAFLHGLKPIQTSKDVQNFLRAICDLEDRATCVEKIGCSKTALEVLRKSLRFDISSTFINGILTELLVYLSAPEVKRVANGEFLQRVLHQVVSPSSLWDAMVAAHNGHELTPEAELRFAWLLLELLTWTGDCPAQIDAVADVITREKRFTQSDDRKLRAMGCRIECILQAKFAGLPVQLSGPGGRHDNDFVDYRKVAIYPTEDELTSKARPYLNTAQALLQVPLEARVGHHLDNQFRLLREDFLAELRDDIDASSGKKKSVVRRQRTRLTGLRLVNLHCGSERNRRPVTIAVTAEKGLEQLQKAGNRLKYLKDKPSLLRDRSFGYFIDQKKLITFGIVFRDEKLLTEPQPIVTIRIVNSGFLEKIIQALALSNTVEFVMIDTAAFAYEPVLRCLQNKLELPLWKQLLGAQTAAHPENRRLYTEDLEEVIRQIESMPGQDLKEVLKLASTVKLDESQTASLVAGLSQPLSAIQGPPGTGKSFIGALLAKTLHDFTTESVLVICYTNHALDQFLEDLMTIGISPSSMVRLGSKSTANTHRLLLRQQASPRMRSPDNWDSIKRLGHEADDHEEALKESMESLLAMQASPLQLLDYLELSDDYDFFKAFEVLEDEDGFQRVAENNKIVHRSYLLERWIQGRDQGIFAERSAEQDTHIWTLDLPFRTKKVKEWEAAMLSEVVETIVTKAASFDNTQCTLQQALSQNANSVIQQKRIVGCTTTAAAMYARELQNASPGIVLVEEAGEILESHVLTALTESTKQLILIGDHRQLRPKVNNYSLTVERGDGYDLNRSLFERLVISGFPHSTLTKQHRMCPEISNLVRRLTYPDLSDAPATRLREPLRGLQQRVVFVQHEHQEFISEMADRRDQGSAASKQNPYEVQLVKKIVKYLAQQGYGTSTQVVLTPYLGQLGLLRSELASDTDPVLNDLDSFDLIRAGLKTPASASHTKRSLRLSTIDNYQGEESDIVVVSLTRSNPNSDIGFMVSPERLNVMLSRARKALIIIGNPVTFKTSRKGGELWSSFLDILAETDSIHNGLPVQCEQHKDRKMVLESPIDFDRYCPDGGCSADCGVLLSCGAHRCPRKCHRVADHTKVKCAVLMRDTCPKGHVQARTCSAGHSTSCRVCDAEVAARLACQQRDLKLEQKRQENQVAYAKQLGAIEEQLDHMKEEARRKSEKEDQTKHLQRRQKDLKNARARHAQKEAATESTQVRPNANQEEHLADTKETINSPRSVTSSDFGVGQEKSSEALLDWEYQKCVEGAVNSALDDLMHMIGLETVKAQFLEIKAKIDLLVRQQLSDNIEKERFGAVLLGNPGTGKTTVARLYAQFLCSVGALPGDEFVEASGAKLANDGVGGCRKMLDGLLNKGGGAFFIDEAYQLTSGSNLGGTAVLDFLLNEVENLTGKVVFILAGYNKQMEKFFQHNPGLPSRFPQTIQFLDYENDELLEILNQNLHKRYAGLITLKGGSRGLFARIVARRIGRGRGKEGFGNAREVQNVLSKVASRQATRLRQERKAARKSETVPDDMLLTQEDLLGPEPSCALRSSKPWMELLELTGLQSVKDSIKALMDAFVCNYERELAEQPLVEFSLNKVFLGNPGTGKTTVAKLYGQVLADIGMLSSGEIIVKKPADFVGSVLGASEANTKAILDAAVGKVLVIDEAYGLYASTSVGDPYRTGVIDTIVAEIQSVPGEDRCVLLLGYQQQMEEMMQNSNPGLARRFPIDSGFLFEDFSDNDLAAILDMKLKRSGYYATQQAKKTALGMLQRARNRPHFGNAGEVDILLNEAKLRQQKRLAVQTNAPKATLEAQDFDADFDRGERAVTNVSMLFKDTVGCDAIVEVLQGYQNIVVNMRLLDEDPREQIPFSFLFRGPPGTGKTTTAQKMGKVFYDMGFLASAEVKICSASDLVGEYIGQTGPKTRKLFEAALGKVLFIDEAYRLAGGHFAQEAMDELVDCMTNVQFKQKLIVILAGYDADINRLMSSNPGLTSRFPETIVFTPLAPEHCLALLTKNLGSRKHCDVTSLSVMEPQFRTEVIQKFSILADSANFANARDVQTLSKTIYAKLIQRPDSAKRGIKVTSDLVVACIDSMIAERIQREADAATAGTHVRRLGVEVPLPQQQELPESKVANFTSTTDIQPITGDSQEEKEEPEMPEHARELPDIVHVRRDAGVSDETWNQLQIDRQRVAEVEAEVQEMLAKEQRIKQWLKSCADAKQQKELEELERVRREVEARREQEVKVEEMLRRIGRCPAGFQWIRQVGGYRCAGGAHWASDLQVSKLSEYQAI